MARMNVHESKKHGKVVINVFQAFSVETWFSTWATIQSLRTEECKKLFDKICEHNGEYVCGKAKNLNGEFVKTASDAYISREYAIGLNREDAGENKAWLLEKMGTANCLVYRPLTSSIATLDESGNSIKVEEVDVAGAAATQVEL